MATLEEIIKQRLAEATTQVQEATTKAELKKPDEVENTNTNTEIELEPKLKKDKKKVCEDTSITEQVSALFESENGLSQEFKEKATAIFEGAVADKILVIEESLKQEFSTQLAEAKQELEKDIDGFLSEVVQQWKLENQVQIKTNFKSQVAESFMDGVKALMLEHKVELEEGKEDALEVALGNIEKVNESLQEKNVEINTLNEEISSLKAEKILESFKAKMTQTEFDRFEKLTESIKFTSENQYAGQLNTIVESFVREPKKVISEQIEPQVQIVTESNSDVSQYAKYISTKKR